METFAWLSLYTVVDIAQQYPDIGMHIMDVNESEIEGAKECPTSAIECHLSFFPEQPSERKEEGNSR